MFFCAIEREKWGKELMSGTECTKPNQDGLIASDIVIAFPDSSYGVHMELGWASILKKRIIVLTNTKIGIKTPLVEDLNTITKANNIFYTSRELLPTEDVWQNILLPQIKELLSEEILINKENIQQSADIAN